VAALQRLVKVPFALTATPDGQAILYLLPTSVGTGRVLAKYQRVRR
jgi:hypothetical protein